MLKKFNVLALIVLLVFQTMIAPIAATAQGTNTTETPVLKDGVLVDDQEEAEEIEGELSSTRTVGFEWTLNENVEIGEIYTSNIPENSTVEQEQTGKLTYEAEAVGLFSVTADGVAVIEFDEGIEGLPEAATGTFEIEVVIEKDETEKENETGENNEEGQGKEVDDPEDNAGSEELADVKVDSRVDETEKATVQVKKKEDEDSATQSEESKDKKDVPKGDTLKGEFQPKSRLFSENEEGNNSFHLSISEVTDLSGNPFTESYPFDPDGEFNLQVDWLLENNHGYTNGDTITFDLPGQLQISDDVEDMTLEDSLGNIVAIVNIGIDKQVILTFTDYVENASNVSGEFSIIAALDQDKTKDEDGKVTIDPIGEEGALVIPIDMSNRAKDIGKQGMPNNKYEADYIDWIVTVNKGRVPLSEAKIMDVLPPGTEYVSGTLEILQQETSINGTVLSETDVTDQFTSTTNNGEISVDFGAITDQYVVKYQTTIENEDGVEFKNEVTFETKDEPGKSAEATVQITRGEPLTKQASATGFDPKTGIIGWEIEFNYNQKELSGEILTDSWTLDPADRIMNLVEGSLVFTEMEIDEDGNATSTGTTGLPGGAEIVPTTNGFEVIGITTDKPYKVTYQTEIEGRVMDELTVSNTASFGTHSATGEGLGKLGNYYGSKSASGINYADKTVDWRIELNHDEYPMEKISIEDTLGPGLYLVGDSLAITVDGQPYTGDYELLKEDGTDWEQGSGSVFVIKFPDEFQTDKKIDITYKTTFVADQVTDYQPTNSANITWTPTGSDTSITKGVSASTEFNPETQNMNWKSASYNPATKKITWTIITNYRENTFGNLRIEDTLQGNQKLVEDSFVVNELNILDDEEGTYEEGNSFPLNEGNLNIKTDTEFELIIGETNKAYKIQYQTSLADLMEIEQTYRNEANIFDGPDKVSDQPLEAEAGIFADQKYGDKSGSQENNSKFADWEILVNLAQEQIANLSLKDMASNNQEYLEHTIKVYGVQYVDGNPVKDEEDVLEQGEDYTLTVNNAEPTFTINWTETVDTAFIVEYSTIFFAGHGADISNAYEITGNGTTLNEDDAEQSSSISIRQTASGSASGTAGRLEINKKDATYDFDEGAPAEKALEGIEFELIDPASGRIVKMGTTDGDGKIDFGRLLFGNYQLVEKNVPEGYIAPDNNKVITINTNETEGATSVEVENYQPVYAVELTKVDSVDSNRLLEDAEFGIYDSETDAKNGQNAIATETTDANGYVVFNLADANVEEAGTYYVKEIRAPQYYQLSDQTHPVYIGSTNREPVNLGEISNTLIPGKGQLTKIDEETNSGDEKVGLADAQFSVYSTEDDAENEQNALTTFVTVVDGYGETPSLAPGEYYIKETSAPEGFEKSNDIFYLTIPEAEAEVVYPITDQGGTTPVDVINVVKRTNIQITKTDSETPSQQIEGVTFEITGYNGDLYNGRYNNNYASLADEDKRATTNNDGVAIFENLIPGTYTIVEQDPVDEYGYIVDSTPFEVEVEYSDVDGDGTPVTRTRTNNPLAKIALEKLDSESDFLLEYAEFELYKEDADSSFVKVENHYGKSLFTTDDNGQFVITGLAPGDYELREVSAPAGYVMDEENDQHIRSFTVPEVVDLTVPGETEEISFTTSGNEEPMVNDIVKGSVKLTKVDGDDGSLLAGVGFKLEATELYNVAGNYEDFLQEYNDDLEEEYTTESDGEIEIGNLRPGKYLFTETNEKEGYQPHTWGDPITFEITVNNDQVQQEVEVKNYKLVDINVVKYWEDLDEELRPESIEVELLRKLEGQSDSEFQSFNPKETINIQPTNGEWKGEFTGLDAVNGQGIKYVYTVEEVKVHGYAEAEPVIELIDEDVLNEFEATLTNEVKTTHFELTKVDSISNVKLEGAEFTLTYPDGTTEVETTDENGTLIFEGLQPGEYELQETGTPAGYFTDLTVHPITVTLDHVEIGDVLTETITNDPFADVQFKKVDAETGVALSGAVFKVINDNGDDVVGYTNLQANSDGTLSITGLPEGSYTLVETIAPTGYALNEDGEDFTVSATNDETDVQDVRNYDNEIIRGSVEFIKTDAEGNLMEEVEFTLESTTLVNSDETYSAVHKTNENGKMFVENLRPGTYIFTEKFPDGYQEYVGKDLTFTIDPVDGETGVDLEEVINHELVDIVVTKEWKDDGNATGTRPNEDGIEIELFKEIENGSKELVESETLTEDDAIDDSNWKYTFEDLDAVDSNGNSYTYTVEELDVEGYTSKVEPAVDGYKITNLRTDTIEIAGEKTWVEADDQYRPDSITVHLLANDVPTDQRVVTVDANDTWKYEFTDLDQFDEEGKEIEYTIEEENILGYTWEVDDEYNLTNTQETINISGTKTWKDNGESRPESITIQVLNSTGVAQEEDFSTENDYFEFTFKDLPKYDKEGNEIEYTINELPVPGYTTEIVGTDITNTRSDIVDVKGTKSWKDDEAEDRPTEITVQLLTNGEAKDEDTVEVTEATNWEYEFTDLVAYDENGLAIEYTVIDDVEGYKANVNGYNITNVRTGTTEVNGEKIWLDDLDEHSAITVELLADGTKVDETEVNAASDWKYEFTDLDKYDEEGKEITYTVDEVKVDGYETIIDNFTITNLRVGTTELLGEKIWLDDDSDERPGSITVQLLANGSVVDTDEVTADSGWEYEFTNLDKYDDQGIEIKYTVDEEEVPEGYEKSFDGNNLTNLRVGTTEVSGEKTWLEVDEQYRPDVITVNLLADGKEVESQDVTIDVDDEWKFTFTDLDKYDAKGKEIDYTIVEVEVPGYVSEVDGYDITNTQETTEITGTKIWKDDDAEDRPMSITVQLMNDDVVVQEQEVTAEDNWNFMFADLAKYDTEGNEIDYMINELPVPGYATAIDGYDITNTMSDQIDVAGTKTWKGDNAEDRPVSITVQLLANGEVVDSVEVTAETDWTYIFENVEAYDAEGIAIVYAVAEIDVDGYETSINGYDITNTLIPVEEDSAVAEENPADKDGGDVDAIDGTGKTVPTTATNIYNIVLTGLGLMLLGLIILLVRRKRIE